MTDLTPQVFERVAHLTGRDVDELDETMTLQGDLGFDSLKIMSLWQAVFGLLPPGVSGDLNDFASVQTLGDLIEALEQMSQQEIVADTRAAYVSETDPGGETIPMAHAQQFFLLSHQLVQSTSLCSSVEVEGRVDRARLQRAWQALLDRHINLRTCFYIPPDAKQLMETQYRLLPDRAAPEPRTLSLADSEDGTWDGLFQEQLNRAWDLRNWPLHEVMIAEVEDGREAIVLANEHIISDGLGNQRLLADLVALYDNPQAELPAVLDGDAYLDAIAQINGYTSPEEEEDFKAREATLRDIQSIWDPKGVVGTNTGDTMFRNLRYAFDRKTTAALKAAAADAGTSLYSVLLASLNARLRDRLALTDASAPAMLQVPTGGKVFPGIELEDTVGCFAQNLSICSRDVTGDLAKDAKAIGAELRDAMICGYDRTQSRLMAHAMKGDFPVENGLIPRFALDQARKSLRSNLYAPYVGESTLPTLMDGMALSGYRSATKNASGTVDILHEIHDGQLIAFANYDVACFDAADIEALMQEHIAALEAWIAPAAATEPAADALMDNLRAETAKITHRDAAQIAPEADLQSEVGLDSLGKIRLVNAVAAAKGGRKLARALVDCKTLSQMAAVLAQAEGDTAATPATQAAPAQPSQALTLDPDLPEIPLRHIEAQVARTPDAEAVTDGVTSLSYAELDREANRLAHTLSAQGIGKGDTVAVTCARGPGMLTALLGILKLGAAYVPLDPAFPAERMCYIAEHARCQVWVGDLPQIADIFADTALPDGITKFVGLGETATGLDAASQVGRGDWSADASQPQADIDPDDLMVLLYTSGSTGHPKGVACHHRGYMNRLDWHQEQFQLCPGERVALKTSFSFDVSVWELFWPLMVGGTICAASRELVSNPWHLADWLAEQRIAVMHFVPSLFNEFVKSNCSEKLELPHMRWLVFSGEALGVKPVRTWMTTQGDHIRLANLYGPTEASIDVTCEVIDEVPAQDATRISIGSAIKNTQMLILDADGQPITEPGVQGELCIAGVQLASGYHRDIRKTAKAFTFNHLQDHGVPGLNIYRTGDLAQWHEGGEGRVDYLGRLDSQVKLRGFRIELGEIEAVLAAHPNVHEAAALVIRSDDDSQDQLVAHYAPQDVPVDELRAWAARKLAEYAVPDRFTGHAGLPKNHNGKLDRNALRDGQTTPAAAAQTNVVSLPAPKPANAAQAPTPATDQGGDIVAPVSPAQAALLHSHGPSHCGASLLMLDYEAQLDVERFVQSVRKVIDSHAALRSVFERQNSKWMRRTLKEVPAFEADIYDASDMDETAFRDEFKLVAEEQALAFRPNTWPLISVQIAKRGDRKCSIAILGSTLIGDMVGAFAFGRAIWQHYLDTEGRAPQTSVGDSQELRALYAEKVGADSAGAADWWRAHLGAVPDGTSLPADMPCGDNTHGSTQEASHAFELSETIAITDAVAHVGEISLYDAVAASLYRGLATVTKDHTVTVAHRVNGRNVLPERIYFDSIDCFAYNFPLSLPMVEGERLAETAERLCDMQRAVPQKGYSYDAVRSHLPASHWPASQTTRVRLNFLGEARTPQNSAVRFVPDASSGRIAPAHGQRDYELDCVVQLREGRLTIALHYSENLHAPETVEGLLEGLTAELRAFSTDLSKKDLTHAA